MEIIDIIIVNNNISGPKIDHLGTPHFIGKVYHCTSSTLTDCLQLPPVVAYYCVRSIAVSPIPMVPGYLTDPFTLNNSVYDCHTCNCTNIPVKKYNLSLGFRPVFICLQDWKTLGHYPGMYTSKQCRDL